MPKGGPSNRSGNKGANKKKRGNTDDDLDEMSHKYRGGDQ